MRKFRTLLYVPGNKPDWVPKAIRSGPDALVLDLEDSVPFAEKDGARRTCAEAIRAHPGMPMFVRINSWGSGRLVSDVLGVIDAQPVGFMLPKASARDVAALDALMSEVEIDRGLVAGRVEIVPLPETIDGYMDVFGMCRASPRVRRCSGGPTASPTGGDVARAMGWEWTGTGLESLYADSKAIMEAKAAGVIQVFGGTSTRIDNLELLRQTATRARQWGCYGATVLHPTHVAVVNEVYSPSQAQIDAAHDVLKAMEGALEKGTSVTRHNGVMIDYAHARNALALLDEAHALGLDSREISPIWNDRALLR